MVTWSDDINISRICDGINKYIARYKMRDYYILGLQQEGRPHVRISPMCPDSLKELFQRSGYTLEVRDTNERYCEECDQNHSIGSCCCYRSEGCETCNETTITIGIRRDIRRDIKLTRKLIKTIIFAVEGKLIIEPTAKLNFGTKVKKTPPKKEKQGLEKVLEKVQDTIHNILPEHIPAKGEPRTVYMLAEAEAPTSPDIYISQDDDGNFTQVTH